MKYRNLARNSVVMAYLNAIAVAAVYAGWRLLQGDPLLGWLGVLLTTAPLVAYIGYALVSLRVPRTSERLMLIGVQAALGTALAGYGALDSRQGWLPAALAGAFLLGFIWYAYRFAGFPGARPSRHLAQGRRLPDFVLHDAQGQAVTSEQLFRRPMVLIFYRGNWCPFCVAQVKELAQRYREIESLAAGVAFISPQPQARSAALSRRFEIPAHFLVDDGNALARRLGIDSPCGIPTGLQVLGYDSDTVMPTVVIVAPGGRILWVDETDNYRVRPEPDTYLRVLRGVSPGGTEAGHADSGEFAR